MEDHKPGSLNSSLTPSALLERAANIYGDRTSIIYENTRYTWSETYTRCRQLADTLHRSLGIGHGDVVSVVAPNIPAMFELHFAVPFAGAVLNNISTGIGVESMSDILRHAKPKLLVVDCKSRDRVLKAIPPDARRPTLVHITDDSIERTSSYEELVKAGDKNFQWIRPESESDPMILNYMPGDSSSLKELVQCHRGSFMSTIDSLIAWDIPKHPVFLWSLNIFHSNGWSFPWVLAAMGGTNICVRDFDYGEDYASKMFNMIESHGVTHICLSLPKKTSGQELKAGGSSPTEALVFGGVSRHGYGLTETGRGPGVASWEWKPEWNSLLAMPEMAEQKARQGLRAIGLAEMDVVDPYSGESVKRDGSTLGEVVFRGLTAAIFSAMKDREEIPECFKDGWFYTDDFGVMHSDGCLEIKYESKEGVKLEYVLNEHPAVEEAAVVPVLIDNKVWLWLFLVLKKGLEKKPTEGEILEYCRKKMPQFMPKNVELREELPKTTTDDGKKTIVKRYVLKKEAKDMARARTTVKKGTEAKMMMGMEGVKKMNVVGPKIRTDMHAMMVMMQRPRSNMNVKIFPKFALAKPSAAHFTVRSVNSGSSFAPIWL